MTFLVGLTETFQIYFEAVQTKEKFYFHPEHRKFFDRRITITGNSETIINEAIRIKITNNYKGDLNVIHLVERY